jgi:hypothetical protein
MATDVSANGTVPSSKVFELAKPFEHRGATYARLTAREPTVRDMRQFLKEVDRDAIAAVEKVLSNLTEVDEQVFEKMSIADFAAMKKWFEDFLKPMLNDSDN